MEQVAQSVRAGAPQSAADLFRRDGVVHLKNALSKDDITLIEEFFSWRTENPNENGRTKRLYPSPTAEFESVNGVSVFFPPGRRLLRETPVVDIAAEVFGGGPVWYVEDQTFYKEGRETGARRTPWHQDSSYLPWDGMKSIVLWIPLDPIRQEDSLEVVRGSHLGPTFARSSFSEHDDTATFPEDEHRPRLPDIQAAREKFDIAAWPHEVGDVLAFHMAALHGGGGTRPGVRRRSVSLRFIGDDVVRTQRPPREVPPYMRHIYDLEVGRPLHQSGMPRVQPWDPASTRTPPAARPPVSNG